MNKKMSICWSGGKDSTAMLLRMIERKEQIDKIVFCDTLLEFQEMYDYIDKIKDIINIPVTTTNPNKNFLEWFLGEYVRGRKVGQIRGFPLVKNKCWYMREAKLIQSERENKYMDIVCIGYAKGEEHRNMKDTKYKYPLQEWGWTEDDCINYLKKKGLENPLYKDFNRLGCYLCHKQPKDNMYILYKKYRPLFNIMLMLESVAPQGFNPNYTLKQIKEQIESQDTLTKFMIK